MSPDKSRDDVHDLTDVTDVTDVTYVTKETIWSTRHHNGSRIIKFLLYTVHIGHLKIRYASFFNMKSLKKNSFLLKKSSSWAPEL